MFFVEKKREQSKSFSHFSTKNTDIFEILKFKIWNFYETLTNDAVSFEQLGPGNEISAHEL